MADRTRRGGFPFRFLATFILITACEGSTDPSAPGKEEIDLDALFRPATTAEIEAIEADWATRKPVVEGVQIETTYPIPLGTRLGTARIVSHLVDGNRHYGAVIAVSGASARSLPVIVFAHPGDAGVSEVDVAVVLGLFGTLVDDFVFVVPSFRAEALTAGGRRYQSEGAASPWDRDVDDALALLDVALGLAPEADPDRIAALGFSRGGGVALLMGIRDPRVDLVVEFAGPTNFFGPYVRGIVEAAVDDAAPSLPGVVTLDSRYIQPLLDGDVSTAEVRLELVRRSPVLFADRLPPTQIHHGTADDVVAVSQAESLIAALEALPRPAAADETFLYPGAGHNPLEMTGSIPRTLSFLNRLRQ